jgi:hypothetical protein
MNLKGFAILSFFVMLLIPNWSCDKKGDLLEMHFNETQCANPWSTSLDDTDYLNKVEIYLTQKNIKIKNISITNDGPLSYCFSCFCSTGRRINITIYEESKNIALEIGFSSD